MTERERERSGERERERERIQGEKYKSTTPDGCVDNRCDIITKYT